jgi:hypothetical protein
MARSNSLRPAHQPDGGQTPAKHPPPPLHRLVCAASSISTGVQKQARRHRRIGGARRGWSPRAASTPARPPARLRDGAHLRRRDSALDCRQIASHLGGRRHSAAKPSYHVSCHRKSRRSQPPEPRAPPHPPRPWAPSRGWAGLRRGGSRARRSGWADPREGRARPAAAAPRRAALRPPPRLAAMAGTQARRQHPVLLHTPLEPHSPGSSEARAHGVCQGPRMHHHHHAGSSSARDARWDQPDLGRGLGGIDWRARIHMAINVMSQSDGMRTPCSIRPSCAQQHHPPPPPRPGRR